MKREFVLTKFSKNSMAYLALLSMTVALTACGGGGGSSPAPVPTPPAPVPTPAPTPSVAASGTLVTSVAAASYAASAPQADAYAALNDVRSHAGAGLLAQNASLDTSAQAHADYLTTNLTTVGLTHTEDSAMPGFYAATFDARETKAGYSYGTGTEVIGGCAPGSGFTYGLLATVYHGAALLSTNIDIGYGVGTDAGGAPLCVADLGTKAGVGYLVYGQVPAAGALVAYPYAGQTNVQETFYVSYESPRVDVSILPAATAGTPVFISMLNADYLNLGSNVRPTVTSFTMVDAANNPIPVKLLAPSSITAGPGVSLNADSKLADGLVVLVPVSPLARNATYTVTFSGTLSASTAALTKTWSFTTNP